MGILHLGTSRCVEPVAHGLHESWDICAVHVVQHICKMSTPCYNVKRLNLSAEHAMCVNFFMVLVGWVFLERWVSFLVSRVCWRELVWVSKFFVSTFVIEVRLWLKVVCSPVGHVLQSWSSGWGYRGGGPSLSGVWRQVERLASPPRLPALRLSLCCGRQP